MKTSPSARYLVRMRTLMVCGILAGIVGLEFYLGASLAARIGQNTANQTDSPASPDAGLSDFMSAVH